MVSSFFRIEFNLAFDLLIFDEASLVRETRTGPLKNGLKSRYVMFFVETRRVSIDEFRDLYHFIQKIDIDYCIEWTSEKGTISTGKDPLRIDPYLFITMRLSKQINFPAS